MRKLILYIAASIDGKIARSDDSIDWLPDPTDEDYGYKEFYDSLDTVLMGYKTYEVCRTLGPWYYKGKKSYILSRQAGKPVIPEAELINDNPVAFTQKLKEQEGGNIWIVGGGQIITMLHDAGLIDEYIIAFIPIILGEGIELFPKIKAETALTLTRHQVYKNGVFMTYYEKKQPA